VTTADGGDPILAAMERAERAAVLAAEAERIVRALAERGATLVVAFGSFGRGDVDPWSDLDILAVMESDLPFVERLAEL
jgi:predicted nucleotidyltransferase